MSRPTWDEYFFSIARAVSLRSTCPRLAVGAVLVRDNRVLSVGYNGAPSGQPHCIDVGCDMRDGHCVRTIHAERNALDFFDGPLGSSLTMYTTHTPCAECSYRMSHWRINTKEEMPYASSANSIQLPGRTPGSRSFSTVGPDGC